MPYPEQGHLLQNENNEWYFKPGRSRKTKYKCIILEYLKNNSEDLVTSRQLFRGWIQSKHALAQYQSSYAKLYHTRRCSFLQTSDHTLLSDTNLLAKLNDENLDIHKNLNNED